MINVAYRITAVPERFNNASIEAERMQVGNDQIYLDINHNGNIWNKFRVYKDIIADGNYTHVCMNDDDLIIPTNFPKAVECLVQKFPDCIFTFYNSKIGSDTPKIIRLKHHYMNGASCVIPTKYLSGFLDFYENNLQGFKWDDTSMSIYALLNDIDVLLPCPKFVNVIRTKSTLSMRKGRYQPTNFGKIYNDIVDIDKICKAPIVNRNGVLKTHLPENHSVSIMCRKKLMGVLP